MRLNVPAGSSVRFEPGESKTVTLVEVGGKKVRLSGLAERPGCSQPRVLPAPHALAGLDARAMRPSRAVPRAPC
mgnify:FL=1